MTAATAPATDRMDVSPAAVRSFAELAHAARTGAAARCERALARLAASEGASDGKPTGAAEHPEAPVSSTPSRLLVACAAEEYMRCVAATAQASARLASALAAPADPLSAGALADALCALRSSSAPLNGRAWARASELATVELLRSERAARESLRVAVEAAIGDRWPPPADEMASAGSEQLYKKLFRSPLEAPLKAALGATLRAQPPSPRVQRTLAQPQPQQLWALDALVALPLRSALERVFAGAGAAAALGRPELMYAYAQRFDDAHGAAIADGLVDAAGLCVSSLPTQPGPEQQQQEQQPSHLHFRAHVKACVAASTAGHLRAHTLPTLEALAGNASMKSSQAALASDDALRGTLRAALAFERALGVRPGAACAPFASARWARALAAAEARALLSGDAPLRPDALAGALEGLACDYEAAPPRVGLRALRLTVRAVAKRHLFELDMRLKEQEAMGLTSTTTIVVAGGVAADAYLAHRVLEDFGTSLGLEPVDESALLSADDEMPEDVDIGESEEDRGAAGDSLALECDSAEADPGANPDAAAQEALALALARESRRYAELSAAASDKVGTALARVANGKLSRPAAASVWLSAQLRALRERMTGDGAAPEAFAATWRRAAAAAAALLDSAARSLRPPRDAPARRDALLDAFGEVTRRPQRYLVAR